MFRFLKYVVSVMALVLMVACGGGGGSAGGSGGTTTTTGTTTVVASSFIYQIDKPTMNNSGGDKIALSITALDTNNNPVKGATATVAIDTGVYTPLVSLSDDKGQLTGEISIGGNKANRTMAVTMTLNGKSTTFNIAVTGSQITVNASPTTVSPSGAVKVTIKVQDSNSVGVGNIPVSVSGTLGLTRTLNTDFLGNAELTLAAAPSKPGVYDIDVGALGISKKVQVQVVDASGSTIPVVTSPITAANLSINPNTIAPNAAGSTTNRATIRAVFQDANNQAIPNVRVRFEIVQPGLGSGEQIAVGDSTVYSDSSGVATTDYIAGTRTSPTNGVLIRACFGPSDLSISTPICPAAQTLTAGMTVATRPLSIALGDNNKLETGNSGLTYIKKFDVAVADAAGNAVVGATISAVVDITHYGKGQYSYRGTVINPDLTTSTFAYPQTRGIAPSVSTTGLSTTTFPSPSVGRIWCPNEDTNRNGFIDTVPSPGEDINGSGTLEPRKADIVLSYVGSNVTDKTGRSLVQVEYPQSVGTWLSYTVRVVTNVGGSEGVAQKSYITDVLEADASNGSFLRTPYGDQRCIDPQ